MFREFPYKDYITKIKVVMRRTMRPFRNHLREQFRILTQRSEARATLIDFVSQGDIESLTVMRDGTYITMSDSRRYWWDPDDIVRRMFTVSIRGHFEAKETRFLRSLLRRGDIVFDVGANFGWYTLLFSQGVKKEGQVHAFEPIPRNFDILTDNVKLNGSNNVVLNRQAIGKSKDELTMYLSDIGSSGSFRLHQYQKNFQSYICSVVTIDEYIQNAGLSSVALIKADIEGAELDMLNGAQQLLNSQSKPIWFLEVQEKSTRLFDYTPVDVFILMERAGYSAFRIDDSGHLRKQSALESIPGDYNFVFASEESLRARGVKWI